MTDDPITISRRKILASLGAIGVASTGAGLGTSAYFNDTERFAGNTLTAGELDLKVDWEEHYYDSFSGRNLVSYTEPEDPTAYVGLPDPDDPQVWVHDDDLDAFMGATALEAFPDPNNDGSQETQWEGWAYQPCAQGADLPENLTPTGTGATRTNNADTMVDGTPQPLVNLDDVKPGDFGELTLSFHLCDNPGYVWAQGELVEAMENGLTEPEALADGEREGVVELLDAIQTVWWYDSRGDNVLQLCDEEKLYLTDSGSDPTTLYEVDLTAGPNDADLTELWPLGDTVPNFDQVDAIAATPSGDRIIMYDKESGHLGVYNVKTDTFTDRGQVSGNPGGIVLAGYSPTGTLWAASQDTNDLYTVDISAPSVTAVGDTGITLQGADLVFASDGTMYIWTADGGDQGLYKIDDPNSDTTAVPVDASNVGSHDAKLTGLAIRDSGTGDIVGSDRDNDEIVVISRTTGDIVDRYPMTVGGQPYGYDYGDMTSGKFCGEVFRRGTLRDDLALLATDHGIPLDGNRASQFDETGGVSAASARECFVPGVNHYVGFAWWLPAEVGNEVQGDSVTFDLGFYTEQCRHNDGSNPDSSA